MPTTTSAEFTAHMNKLYHAGFYKNIIKFFEDWGITGQPMAATELAEISGPRQPATDFQLDLLTRHAGRSPESIVFNDSSRGQNLEIIFSPKTFAQFLIKNFNYNKKMLEFNRENLSGRKIVKTDGKIIVINLNNDE